MIQKLRDRLTNGKKDNKGFTLVELIVVIVILAILAALLVPALVGWIDKAREKTYAVEARSVYLAAQTYVSENYTGAAPSINWDDSDVITEIEKLSGIGGIDISSVTYGSGNTAKQNKITGMEVAFTPSNGSGSVTMILAGDTWTKKS